MMGGGGGRGLGSRARASLRAGDFSGQIDIPSILHSILCMEHDVRSVAVVLV